MKLTQAGYWNYSSLRHRVPRTSQDDSWECIEASQALRPLILLRLPQLATCWSLGFNGKETHFGNRKILVPPWVLAGLVVPGKLDGVSYDQVEDDRDWQTVYH